MHTSEEKSGNSEQLQAQGAPQKSRERQEISNSLCTLQNGCCLTATSLEAHSNWKHSGKGILGDGVQPSQVNTKIHHGHSTSFLYQSNL